MKKIAFLIDSSFGIKNEQYPDVFMIPMDIIENNNGNVSTYLDTIDITNKELCEKINKGIDIKTSQPTIGKVIELLDKLTKEYESVYSFPIPASISGTYSSWVSIAKDYSNVHVFKQTMVGRLAEWTIIDLLKMYKDGSLTVDDVNKYLDKTSKNRAGVLIVPDITQLKKGGRVSNFKSLLIKLLGLKLVITLDEDGLLFKDKASKLEDVFKKALAALDKCVSYSKKQIKRIVIYRNDIVDKEHNVNGYIEMAKETFSDYKIEMTTLPSVIVAHSGTNYFVLGIDTE